jgi:hypothetical protein
MPDQLETRNSKLAPEKCKSAEAGANFVFAENNRSYFRDRLHLTNQNMSQWLPLFLTLILLLPASRAATGSESVRLVPTPNGGIQPQAVIDREDTVHLIYFLGAPAAGDIYYVRQKRNEEGFSSPVKVNSRARSVMAVGTIRGAQLALGRSNRVHVTWNGPVPTNGTYMEAPMLYTRLNDRGTAFEPERNLITSARGLDGGGSVAADDAGRVFVMWHAPKPGNTNGEAGRALFVARSQDDGKTFAAETLATRKPTGACGCCGTKAFADNRGNVYALFRSAAEPTKRDEVLLISRDQGEHFDVAGVHPWKIAGCPMSSASFSDSPAGVLAAWETENRVFFGRINRQTFSMSPPKSPPGAGARKHPVVVGNARSEILMAWTEGTGWAKGGGLAWQLFQPNGQPGEQGKLESAVPVWGLISAVANSDGQFLIFY